MKGKNKNIKPDSSDFIRYEKGEMTGVERNAFEKELQKNKFMEEALEGFESASNIGLERDLSLLGNRLANRTRKRSNRLIYRIAASIAVMMIVSSVFIVVEKNKRAPSTISEQESAPFTIARAEPMVKPENKPVTEEKQETASQNKKKAILPSELREEEVAGAKTPEKKDEEFIPVIPDIKPAEEPAQEEKKELADQAVSNPAVAMARTAVSSKAVAEENPSIAGESIPVSINTARAVKAGGNVYQIYRPAEPETGKEAYENYIEENIRRPDSSGQRTVVLTGFMVKTDGSIDSIKIIRSPGNPFSVEAIRLIRSGPRWRPAVRNGVPVDDSVNLRIVFK